MKSEYPSLRWGLSTLGCPELTLPEAVALADQYGMEFLELRTISNSSMVFNTLYLPENAPCARQLTAAGRCRVLDSAFFLAVQNDSAREELLKIARTADDFKIPYIRIFGRFPASGLSDELLDTKMQVYVHKKPSFRKALFSYTRAKAKNPMAEQQPLC